MFPLFRSPPYLYFSVVDSDDDDREVKRYDDDNEFDRDDDDLEKEKPKERSEDKRAQEEEVEPVINSDLLMTLQILSGVNFIQKKLSKLEG